MASSLIKNCWYANKSVSDCDDMVSGIYARYNPENSYRDGWAFIFAISMTSNYTLQLGVDTYNNALYMRTCDAGSWRSWTKIT